MSEDNKTADAFATSWNNLPLGSVYKNDQVEDWFYPLNPSDLKGKSVLELGCGNGSLMVHVSGWEVKELVGVDLGSSLIAAKKNMQGTGRKNWKLEQADLVNYESEGYDVVYSIGVLHHLKNPQKGFDSVINNTKPGGAFHCWVYAWEGNAVVRLLVDPIRLVASKLPWWINKYFIALPLSVPFYFYSKLLSLLKDYSPVKKMPLYDYALWISQREFGFFRHVAFDQLVTPQTAYIKKSDIERWMFENNQIDQKSKYIILRNGNSWKFGAKKSGM